MKEEIYKKTKIYLIYTGIFAILSLAIYSIFIMQGKSFIWEDDGFNQHFAIFYNFNEMIRNCFQNGFSTFSWNLGLGIDVIGQYSYYILGDPFAYISLLFPMEKLEFAYEFLILLRMYFIGIAFLEYCKYNKKQKYNSIIGAIIYTFSGFVLYAGVRHPYFINALIMFPLVLMGIDKIYKEDKKIFFTIVIAITAIINYYFLYKITVLAFIYAIVKYFCEYKKEGYKYLFKKFVSALGAYIIGIMIAGIILLPTIYAYINSNRLGNIECTDYGVKYYKTIFAGLTSNHSLYWTRICVSSIALIILPISAYNLKNKENKTILICIIIETIMLLFSFFGSVMNGLSFQSNRWVFGYVFLLAYMVVLNLKEDLMYSKKEVMSMLIVIVIYVVGLLICSTRLSISTSLVSVMFAMLMIITIILNDKFIRISKVSKYIILFLIMLNIVYYGRDLYNSDEEKYIDEFVSVNNVMNQYNNYSGKLLNYNKAIEKIKTCDNGFYRISNNIYSNTNIALIHNYKSINAYLSLGNRYVGLLSKQISNRTYNSDTNPLRELDSRTKITTLLGNKYYVVPKGENSYVPYGYEKYQDVEDTTSIYINKNALPIGVFYDSYITEKEYEKFTHLEKEQAILDTAVVKNTVDNIGYNNKLIKDVKDKTAQEIEFKIKDKSKIINNNKITTKKKNQSIILNFKDVEDCELYVELNNFEADSNKKHIIQFEYGNIKKSKVIRNPVEDPYYIKNDNILINMGYKKVHSGKIKITFSEINQYSYDNIKVIAVPMKNYEESIEKLKETKFELQKYDNEFIEGNINNQKSGILQFSTPYTKGWTAYVDGKKTEIIKVNTAFIGINLEKGNHKIILKYNTPYLKEGIIITIIGIVLLIISIIYKKRENKMEM